MRRYLPLICLSLTHTLVDTTALLIAPLWPSLEARFQFGVSGLSLAFVVQSLPTSISQVWFGYQRDRKPAPVWLWLGPVLGALFLPLLGVAPDQAALFAILILGGIGIGAFHPEAAVAAGRLLPGQRTRGLSVFMFGGSLGLAIGPLLGGTLASAAGLTALIWLIVPFIVVVFVLRQFGGLADICERAVPNQAAARPTISEMLHGRAGFAIVLLLVCSLRLVPNMGMDKVLSFALEAQGVDEAVIGRFQSVFLVSASVGMAAMAWLFRPGWEKPFMVACPLLSIPLLWALSRSDLSPGELTALLIPSGIVMWGTVPAMVAFAQQQFPRGAGIASAITMGLSWGFGGLIQAPITAWFTESGRVPQRAFAAFIPCLLIAGVAAWRLPDGPPADTVADSDAVDRPNRVD